MRALGVLGALGGFPLICMVQFDQLGQGVCPPPHPTLTAPVLQDPAGCSLVQCVQFSGGHVEELSGFVGVINGQADGSDVLQRL